MNIAKKPRVGFFSFASCEGCQLAFLECEEELPVLLEAVEIVRFREASSYEGREIGGEEFDVVFLEGTIAREKDAEEVRLLRKNAKIVVAFGACATTCGVNAIRNTRPLEIVRREVYGEKAGWYDVFPARPVSAVVPVDYTLRGCPVDRTELVKFLLFLLRDLPAPIPKYPVCFECKAAGVVCNYVRGRTCLGPVTTCGCGAICTRFGGRCEGCRGILPDANLEGLRYAYREVGRSEEDLKHDLQLFNSFLSTMREKVL